MNPKHFHTPPSSRALCPVCKKAVYSPAGIHPQCAMLQSDPTHPSAKKRGFIVLPDSIPTDETQGDEVPALAPVVPPKDVVIPR